MNELLNKSEPKDRFVLTLRIPTDLKQRLEMSAKKQGVSMNQFASYLLNMQLTQIESFITLEQRFSNRNIDELKEKVNSWFKKIPKGEVPDWDRI